LTELRQGDSTINLDADNATITHRFISDRLQLWIFHFKYYATFVNM